jgi:hypothetical protein
MPMMPMTDLPGVSVTDTGAPTVMPEFALPTNAGFPDAPEFEQPEFAFPRYFKSLFLIYSGFPPVEEWPTTQ